MFQYIILMHRSFAVVNGYVLARWTDQRSEPQQTSIIVLRRIAFSGVCPICKQNTRDITGKSAVERVRIVTLITWALTFFEASSGMLPGVDGITTSIRIDGLTELRRLDILNLQVDHQEAKIFQKKSKISKEHHDSSMMAFGTIPSRCKFLDAFSMSFTSASAIHSLQGSRPQAGDQTRSKFTIVRYMLQTNSVKWCFIIYEYYPSLQVICPFPRHLSFT